MKRKRSLRRGIFVPFIGVVLIALVTFVFLWRLEYNRLAEEQSALHLKTANENIQNKLIQLLGEPEQMARTLRDSLDHLDLDNKASVLEVQNYIKTYLASIHANMPQVSTVFYADKLKNFVGYRVNGQDDFSLMVKDERTQGILNIYKGETMASELLTAIDDYDPTGRPFYKPVIENPDLRWSEIYINYDEINDATLSVIYPLLDGQGRVVGVTGLDVKLNGIYDFLKDQAKEIESQIYIVDDNFNLVAYSESANLYQDPGGQALEDGQFLSAFKGPDALVETSSLHFSETQVLSYEFDYEKEVYNSSRTYLQAPRDLEWQVVSVMKESVILGDLTQRQNVIIGLVVGVLLLGSMWAMVVLTRVTRPILEVKDKAIAIAQGDWDVDIKDIKTNLLETDALTKALDLMMATLKETFYTLSQNEAKYRTLINNLDEMIYIVSPDGSFRGINPKFEGYFERSKDTISQMRGQDFFDGYFKNSRWSDTFKTMCRTKEKVIYKERLSHDVDEDQILNISLIPVLDDQGHVDFAVGSITNVSTLVLALEREAVHVEEENQRLEALVLQRTQDLEVTMKELADHEKLASLGGLVSGVAHEINTPLGVAVTTASYIDKINAEYQGLVENNKMTKNGFIKFMDNIHESIKILNSNLFRASDLIKSFKMIAVNQSHLTLERFDLSQYLQACINSLKHELKRKHHEVTLDMSSDFYIQSYPGVYSQILTNLVMNSIVHGFKDVDHGHIRVRVEKTKAGLDFTYTDNGCGMTKEVLNQIFEPFFTTNRGSGGTGLGLSVVYNLVTGQLKGTIKCESALGQGVKFIMTIPLDEE